MFGATSPGCGREPPWRSAFVCSQAHILCPLNLFVDFLRPLGRRAMPAAFVGAAFNILYYCSILPYGTWQHWATLAVRVSGCNARALCNLSAEPVQESPSGEASGCRKRLRQLYSWLQDGDTGRLCSQWPVLHMWFPLADCSLRL